MNRQIILSSLRLLRFWYSTLAGTSACPSCCTALTPPTMAWQRKFAVMALVTLLTLGAAKSVLAGPIQLMLEANVNRAAGAEVFMAEFNSYADLLSGSLSGSSFSQLNIGANFSIGGLTYDGSAYHLLLESDVNRSGGAEVFLASFSSYADLLSGTLSGSSFSQLNIGANFSVGGLTYDGSEYHMLLESDANRAAGAEIFLASFNSYADLLAGSLSASSFSQLNIGANFGVGGLSYDGSDYHLLLESDVNRAGGAEVFLASFDSFADLQAGSLSASGFSQINIGAGFGVAGLVAFPDATDATAQVAEPKSLALMSLGLLAVALVRRSRPKSSSLSVYC